MAGGVGGVPPTKPKIGGELPTLATRQRVGPKTLVNPKPTGVGGCAPFTLTEVSLFEEGRPSPSTGVASLRPYIEPGVKGAAPPLPPLPTLVGFGFAGVLGPTRGKVAEVGNFPHF